MEAVVTAPQTTNPKPDGAPLPDEKNQVGRFFDAAKVSSVGIEMAVATLIGWGIGYWLDGKLGTSPYLMLVCLLFGVAAGFKGLIRAANEVNQRNRQPEHDGREDSI